MVCMLLGLSGIEARGKEWQARNQFVLIMEDRGKYFFYGQADLTCDQIKVFLQGKGFSVDGLKYMVPYGEKGLKEDEKLSAVLSDVAPNRDDLIYTIRNDADLQQAYDRTKAMQGFITQGVLRMGWHSKHYMVYGTYYWGVGLVVLILIGWFCVVYTQREIPKVSVQTKGAKKSVRRRRMKASSTRRSIRRR